MKHCTLYINGIHCKACKNLIEDIATEDQKIHSATVNMATESVTLQLDDAANESQILSTLNTSLQPYNYTVHAEKPEKKRDYSSLMTAIPIGLTVLIVFFMLQKSGVIDVGFTGGLTPWTAFFIGVIASLSSCLAIVGGLILTLSAQVSQDTSSMRPLVLFHVSRLISFTLLGGLLGIIGNAIAINYTVTSVLGLLAALVMIILGLNLLDIFSYSKKLQLTLPNGIHKKIVKIEKGYFAPIIVGALTFFLPCGFTQSMQLAALSSGSVLTGTTIMAMFALGTLPMLVLISFSSFTFAHTKYAEVFYKSAGVIVIGLGIFAFLTGLAGLGIIRPLLTI